MQRKTASLNEITTPTPTKKNTAPSPAPNQQQPNDRNAASSFQIRIANPEHQAHSPNE